MSLTYSLAASTLSLNLQWNNLIRTCFARASTIEYVFRLICFLFFFFIDHVGFTIRWFLNTFLRGRSVILKKKTNSFSASAQALLEDWQLRYIILTEYSKELAFNIFNIWENTCPSLSLCDQEPLTLYFFEKFEDFTNIWVHSIQVLLMGYRKSAPGIPWRLSSVQEHSNPLWHCMFL